MWLKRTRLIRCSVIISEVIISLFFLELINSSYQKINFVLPKEDDIKVAIIPHHLLARELIEDLGQKIKNNKRIKNVVIVGPNHYETGKGAILTDNNSLKNINIIEDEKTIDNDHSCWAPKSILVNYLHNIPISCILLSSRANVDDLKRIVKEIDSRETLIIASTDFSHYLTKDQADKNDLITEKLIKNRDINSILKLDNGFVDSPKTLAFIFYYLQNLQINNEKIINHLNSSQIIGKSDLTSTTSYFEIVYY